MLQLEVLWAHDGDTIDTWGPWFNRMADNARFTYEAPYISASATFTVEVFHKETWDPASSATSAGSFASITGALYGISALNLKQMIRFKISLTAGGGIDGGVLFRFFDPTWYNQANV